MADSNQKNREGLSLDERLDQVIKQKEAEGKALKKMFEQLEADSAEKSRNNQTNNSK